MSWETIATIARFGYGENAAVLDAPGARPQHRQTARMARSFFIRVRAQGPARKNEHVSSPNGTRHASAVNVGGKVRGKVAQLNNELSLTEARPLCLVEASAGWALWHTSDARHFRERKTHPATGARQPANVQCQLCYSNRDRKSTRSQHVSRCLSTDRRRRNVDHRIAAPRCFCRLPNGSFAKGSRRPRWPISQSPQRPSVFAWHSS